MILYELFEDYKGVEIPTMSIEQLRVLFGLEEKYPNFFDLEKLALIPALEEINQKAGIKMEYKNYLKEQEKQLILNLFFIVVLR